MIFTHSIVDINSVIETVKSWSLRLSSPQFLPAISKFHQNSNLEYPYLWYFHLQWVPVWHASTTIPISSWLLYLCEHFSYCYVVRFEMKLLRSYWSQAVRLHCTPHNIMPLSGSCSKLVLLPAKGLHSSSALLQTPHFLALLLAGGIFRSKGCCYELYYLDYYTYKDMSRVSKSAYSTLVS